MTTARTAREPRSNAEWRLCGALDIGVSHDYASGLAEWAILRGHLSQFGLSGRESACEIGCGAGRMASAVAQDFAVVHALDVSAERIAQARSAPNAARCAFHLVREPAIPLPDESCDLVYSIHVFQHFSGDAADSYFREAYRVLRPGGVLMVHLPVVGAHGFTGGWGEILGRGATNAARALTTLTIRLLERVGLSRPLAASTRRLAQGAGDKASAPVSTYKVFSFVRVADDLARLGFERVELRIMPVRNGHESYLFAGKPAPDLSRTAR